MKNIGTIFGLGLAIAVVLCLPGHLMAESNVAVGGSAQVSLEFQIQIPTILSLRVGSAGATVDTMSFSVTELPGTGEVQGSSSGANPVPVEVRALVSPGSTVTLSADSSAGLTDGATTIGFDEIRWDASGDFSAGRFDTSNAQQLDQFTNSGSRSGSYTFYYDNDTEYPTGTYSGTVTYTLSSP